MGTFLFFPPQIFSKSGSCCYGLQACFPSSKLQVLCLLHTVSYILLASLTFCQHKHNRNKTRSLINFIQLEDMPVLLRFKQVYIYRGYIYSQPSPKGPFLHVMFSSPGPRATQTAEVLSVSIQNHFPALKKPSFPKEGGMKLSLTGLVNLSRQDVSVNGLFKVLLSACFPREQCTHWHDSLGQMHICPHRHLYLWI